MKDRILARAREHHNPRRPWELYIGREDGEYLTGQGVKILVRNKTIVNMVPRHLQSTTTTYADFPTPNEVRRMLKLSDKIQPAAQLSVMDELCNQSISIKEDMEQLEIELKTSMREQIKKVQGEIHDELQKFYTALMDDRIAQLPKQLDQMKEYLSKDSDKLTSKKFSIGLNNNETIQRAL